MTKWAGLLYESHHAPTCTGPTLEWLLLSADTYQLACQIANGDDVGGLPDGALKWLRQGMRRFLRGDCDSLDVALQLTSASLTRARDIELLRAAELLDAGRGLSPWLLAGELESTIKRFESAKLVQLRRGIAVDLSPLEDALLVAFQTGARPKRSRRRLYDMLLTTPR